MSFPRYPEYKDSGVEWLGQVPAHWELDRLKRSLRSERNGLWGTEPQGDENDIPCIRVADFDRNRLIAATAEPTIRSVSEKDREGRLLAPNDLLIEKSGGGETQPVGCVVLYQSALPAICSNFIARLEPAVAMDASFWRYFHAAAYASRINVRSIKQTSGIQNLDTQAYFDERAVFPSHEEQVAISRFLDRETAKIDALVAEQERLIALLKEKRQAVISHAVTKGLDPDAPMKESGIPGVGMVPEGWQITKLKWVAAMHSGHTPDKKISAYWENADIPWVSLNDTGSLRDSEYITDTALSITHAGIAGSSARILPAGVVVLSRDATIGRCAITTRPMAVSQHFIAWECGDRLLPRFLLLRMRSMGEELERLTTGATVKTIGMPEVRTLATPLPPVEEQIQIIEHVDRSVSKIDALLHEAVSAVELLKQRRASIITAAVTGQIDVRDLVLTEAA